MAPMFRKRSKLLPSATSSKTGKAQNPESDSEDDDESSLIYSALATRKRPRLSQSLSLANKPAGYSSRRTAVTEPSSLFVEMHAYDDNDEAATALAANLASKKPVKRKRSTIKTKVTAFYKQFPAEIRQMILAQLFPPFLLNPGATLVSIHKLFGDTHPSDVLTGLSKRKYNIFMESCVKADIAKFLDVYALKLLKGRDSISRDCKTWSSYNERQNPGSLSWQDSENGWVDVATLANMDKYEVNIQHTVLCIELKYIQAWLDKYVHARPSER